MTEQTAARFAALLDERTCTGLQCAALWQCWRQTENAPASFYLADGEAALCLQGRHALLCGFVPEQTELAAFLAACGAESFLSESMLLEAPGWQPDAQLLMRFTGAYPDLYTAEADAAPDLWALAHSPALTGHDAEAWYADVCARKNRGLADVRAIAQDGRYVATAGAYAVREAGVYLSGVYTAKEYRGRGYAGTLLSGLCRRYGAPPQTADAVPPAQDSAKEGGTGGQGVSCAQGVFRAQSDTSAQGVPCAKSGTGGQNGSGAAGSAAAPLAARPLWLLCTPALRGFYEQLGFALAIPVCGWRRAPGS